MDAFIGREGDTKGTAFQPIKELDILWITAGLGCDVRRRDYRFSRAHLRIARVRGR